MKPITTFLGAALALAVLAPNAFADSVLITGQTPGVDLTVALKSDTASPQPFVVNAGSWMTTYTTASGSSPLIAYCVDLPDAARIGDNYTVNSLPQSSLNPTFGRTATNPASGDAVAYLYDTFAVQALNDPIKQSALQLAIWEAEYDYIPSTSAGAAANHLNLTLGNHTFQGAATDATAIVNQANAYLNTMPGSGTITTFSALYLQSTSHPGGNTLQDLLGVTPEPGAISFAAASLVGAASLFLRRRHRAAGARK